MAKDEAKTPRFRGTIAYVQRPIPGIALYSGAGTNAEESVDESLARLDKQEIDAVKRQELVTRIRVRAAEAEQKLTKGGGQGRQERRFAVGPDNRPMLDPDGEYSFNEALRVCATNAIEKTGVSDTEKVSDIINAVQPFLIQRKAEEGVEGEKKLEQSIALKAIEALALKDNKDTTNQMTPLDVLTIAEKLHQMTTPQQAGQRNPLDDLTQLASTFQMLKESFGGNQGPGQGQVVVQMPGMNGGGMPLDAYMKLDDHTWSRRREEAEFQEKRDNAKAIREFFGQIGQAASQVAGKSGLGGGGEAESEAGSGA